MREHWWWRPGWRIGRCMYTWHVTFAAQPRLRDLVTVYQDALAPLPGLDPIPMQWLHLTMQGIGFTDEVSSQDIAASRHVAGISPRDPLNNRSLGDPRPFIRTAAYSGRDIRLTCASA
jgi:hypothetical protein